MYGVGEGKVGAWGARDDGGWRKGWWWKGGG